MIAFEASLQVRGAEPPVGFEPTTPALQEQEKITTRSGEFERGSERLSQEPEPPSTQRNREAGSGTAIRGCGLDVDSHDTDRSFG